jgi:ABC-type histidine transport system ATPase subunit
MAELSFRDVRKNYGDLEVIHGVSMDVMLDGSLNDTRSSDATGAGEFRNIHRAVGGAALDAPSALTI